MSKHTPGPWEADDEFNVYQDGMHIVSVHAKPNETGLGLDWDEASERLALVAAAPDLLAALKIVMAHPHNFSFEVIRAAIAKAEG